MCLLFLLWSMLAFSLDGNDRLVLELNDGTEVHGWFYSVDEEVLVVSGDNRFTPIPLEAIGRITRNEEPLPLEDFRGEVKTRLEALEAERANPPPLPHPLWVGGLSMVWAGSGHAVLGEWTDAKGYAVVEIVILGAGAYNLHRGSGLGVMVSLGALDLLFKLYSAGEAMQLARSRRARLKVD
jgi:hypothetical protein